MAKNSKTPAKRSTASTAAAASKKGTVKKVAAEVVPVDRRESSDRRDSGDRRKRSEPVAVERRVLDRREKVSRRRQIDPTTCERDYTPAEVEFMAALDEYKRRNGRMFPTCSEILEVICSLGYEKRQAAPVQSIVEQPIVIGMPTIDCGDQYTAATL